MLRLILVGRYRSQFGVGVGIYQYVHEDDENSFQLVDSTRLPKLAYQKRPRFPQNVKIKCFKKSRTIIYFCSVFVYH